jgi:RNA-directed DNA polymerase
MKRPQQHKDGLPNASAPAALDLYSFRYLTVQLGFSRSQLLDLSSHAGGYYKPFPKQAKVRPFARHVTPHKKRLIDNPTGLLKVVQSRIEARLLARLAIPEHLLGGVRGKTIKQNAALHFGAPYIVTVDIKNLFPSITPVQIYSVWNKTLNCSPEIAEILTKLTTFRGRLPQGAPTSTLLANFVLGSIDAPIRTACETHRVEYSSWVDDLVLSGECARDILPIVIKLLLESGFKVRHSKISVMRPGEKKAINGLVLGKLITVENRYLKRIRAGIHNLQIARVPQSDIGKYVMSLEGQINYVRLFDPTKAARLRSNLDEISKRPGVPDSRAS